MSELVTIDINEIAAIIAGSPMIHVASIRLGADARSHFFLKPESVLPQNEEDAIDRAELVVMTDGCGGFDAFQSIDGNLYGPDLLSGTPFRQGHLSEFVQS